MQLVLDPMDRLNSCTAHLSPAIMEVQQRLQSWTFSWSDAQPGFAMQGKPLPQNLKPHLDGQGASKLGAIGWLLGHEDCSCFRLWTGVDHTEIGDQYRLKVHLEGGTKAKRNARSFW